VNRTLARVIFGVSLPAPVFIFTGAVIGNEIVIHIGIAQLSFLVILVILSRIMCKELVPTWGEILGK